jgi:hypothetical protein
MIVEILNFLSLSIIIYDTLGYLANYANKASNDKIKADYSRLIYTWVFYLSIKYLGCTTCLTDPECFLGGIFALVFAVVRLLVALPITGVRAILTKKIIEDELLCNLLAKVKSCATGACSANSTETKQN